MRLLGKTALVIGVAGAMAIGSMTASEARGGRNAALAGGFIAGAAIGAAAATANAGYYSGGYGYDNYAYAPGYSYGYDSYAAPAYSSGYDSYAYEPAYAAPAYTPPSYYGPVTTYRAPYSGYDSNYIGPWHERRLQGRD
jgi:hypothetical protein